MAYRILTIDGGGIAGLFAARLLERLGAEHPALLRDVDLIAGTSTGGIIALCLAHGASPAELVSLYAEHGGEIFDDSWFDNIIDVGTAIGSDYDNKKLKKNLERVLGAARLRDLAKRVLIPSFDLDAVDEDGVRAWKPKFFHNYPGSDTDGAELAVDVALRTSAAPTYFPTYQGYIDGGVVANNPSVSAIATALDPRAGKQKLDDIVVLSVSTGFSPQFIKGDHDWGWGQWARPLVGIMISGVMGVAHFQCKQILGDRYRRVDCVLDRNIALDDAGDKAIRFLRESADGVDLAATRRWLETMW